MSTIRKKLHILLVEDSLLDARIITSMLGKPPFGSFDFRLATNLKDACKVLNEIHFDAVILDLNLKGTRGLSTLKKIRKCYPQVAIIVNTGFYSDELGLKAVAAGAQDFLIKGKYKAYSLVKALYYAIERKKYEEDIKNAYTRLKETQGHLIQVEKMNVVGSIASGVAHEVKNPLATILYGIEYLKTRLKDAKDEKMDFTLNSIAEAVRKANNIIKDLLDFASLSKLEKNKVDIHDVIEQIIKLTHHQCEKEGILIEKNFDLDIPLIEIDRNRIEQVLIDIVLNAVHAMPSGGKLAYRTFTSIFSEYDAQCVEPNVQYIKKGDPILVIAIADTGLGIPKEIAGKIFDPFFTTKRSKGGVGLGLSIARTIMRTHDGLLLVQNNSNRGATAKIIFKLTKNRKK